MAQVQQARTVGASARPELTVSRLSADDERLYLLSGSAHAGLARWTRRHLLSIGVALAAAVGIVVGISLPLGLLIASLGLATYLLLDRTNALSATSVLLHLLVASMFLESVGVGALTVGRLLAGVAALAVVLRVSFSETHLPAQLAGVVVPVGALTLVFLASGLWADVTRAWAFAIGQLGLGLAYFLAFATLLPPGPPRRVVRPLLRTYVTGAVLAGFVGLAQVAGGADRAVGLQGDANIYALYQVVALPVAVALWRTSGAPGPRAAWLGALVPLLASIVASQSRGALLSLVPTVLVACLVMAPRRLRLRVTAAAMLAVVTVGVVAVSSSDRLDPDRVGRDRASGRIDIWYVAWRSFTDHPLTGIGAGNFKPASVELLTSVPGVELVKSHLLESSGIEVHNLYLEALAERGLPGLAALLWLLAMTAYRLHRARAPDPSELDALLPALTGFVVAASFLSIANSKLLWLLVGLAAMLPPARRALEEPRP